MISEAKKYLLRFGIPLAAMIAMIAILRPENIVLVVYKMCLIVIGLVLCELIWVISYKPFSERSRSLRPMRSAVSLFFAVFFTRYCPGITWGL